MEFCVSSFSNISFAFGAAQKTGEHLKKLACHKVICIYDKGIKAVGIVDPIIENIKNTGIEVVEFDEVTPDPPTCMVEKAATIAKEENVDGIVAIGGGSVIDTAKGINILLTNPMPITQYEGSDVALNLGKVLITIPTTSGTGSEISVGAVITDEKNQRKMTIIDRKNCKAALAIIDPQLTVGLPPHITASTGIDTLAHAVEAFTTIIANPMSDIYAEKAIELTIKNLPVVVKDGSNIDARMNMSMACTSAGIAMNDNLLHVGHALAHAMGANWHLPHGICCAIALPFAVEFNAEMIPEKVERIGLAMGLDMKDDLSAAEKGKLVADALRDFTKEVGIPSLKELNVDKSLVKNIAENVMKDILISLSHRKIIKKDALTFLESCI